MTQQQQKKRAVEYHFVDMNDPDRYKKLKVARACNYCRRRKAKCDIGVPGSGTCSNCKKSNHVCIFSPVSANSQIVRRKPQLLQFKNSSDSYSASSSERFLLSSITPTPSPGAALLNKDFIAFYKEKFSFFSVDSKGHCGYEKDNTIIYTHTPVNIMDTSFPYCSDQQLEHELVDSYFIQAHPFFPVLDKYHFFQTFQHNAHTIPNSLKWIIMAISLHFNRHLHKDYVAMADTFYQNAVSHLNQSVYSLATIQTLILLYKYQEIITPVGTSFSSTTIGHLQQAQTILQHINSDNSSSQDNTTTDESICRSGWLVFIVLSLSNTADSRLQAMLECCITPDRLPDLTEAEHYDKVELNTTCNLIHLINITILYAQLTKLISDQHSLFVDNNNPLEFTNLAADIKTWKLSLQNNDISLHLSSDHSSDTFRKYISNSEDNSPVQSILYTCLIYDVMDLLLNIHTTTDYNKDQRDFTNKVDRIYYQASSLAREDMSRMGLIQGNRFVVFSLTLALQAKHYAITMRQQQYPLLPTAVAQQEEKQLSSLCNSIFQIFEQVGLTRQFYITIQAIKNQTEAKNQPLLEDYQQPDALQQQLHSFCFQDDDHHQQRPNGLNNDSRTTNSSSSSNNIQQISPWPQYASASAYSDGSSNNTTASWSSSSLYHRSMTTTRQDKEYHYNNMPITPTMEETQKNRSPMLLPPQQQQQEPHVVDSYFHSQGNVAALSRIDTFTYNYDFNADDYYSKSCKNKEIII